MKHIHRSHTLDLQYGLGLGIGLGIGLGLGLGIGLGIGIGLGHSSYTLDLCSPAKWTGPSGIVGSKSICLIVGQSS